MVPARTWVAGPDLGSRLARCAAHGTVL